MAKLRSRVRRHPWKTLFLALTVTVLAAIIGFVNLISERSTLLYATQFILGGRDAETAGRLSFPSSSAEERFARVQESYGGAPLISGNRVTLLKDGPATYDAMWKAVESAKNHVNLETYIIKDDGAGQAFAERLKRRASAGVEVNLLYDRYGSLDTSGEFFSDLEDGGVRVRGFQDIMEARIWRIHQRDHRKLLIVDGHTAFIGGINISDEYLLDSSLEPGEEQGLEYGWRDTHARVEGPVVGEMQRLFLETWLNAGARTTAMVHYFPPLDHAGNDTVGLIYADRFDTESRILDSYIGAIKNARERIWITQAYFVPHFEFVQSLIDAVQAGVDVRVITPAFTDIAMVLYASQAHYEPLLESGVRICEMETALLHAKTAVIDGMWSTVGSSNLDIRSLEHNHEANIVVIGAKFASELEAMFEEDEQGCRPVSLDRWRDRGLRQRLKERASLMMKYWL